MRVLDRTASARRGRPRAARVRAGRSSARSSPAAPRSPCPRRTGTRARSCRRASSTCARDAARSARCRCRTNGSGRRVRSVAARPRADAASRGPSGARRAQAAVAARAIRQRSSGCSSTGTSEASCAQYSNSSRRTGPAVCAVRRVEQLAWVRPEAGKHGQVVAAAEHVDRVELQEPICPMTRRMCRASMRPRRPRVGEALRGERDPPRLRRSQPHSPTLGSAVPTTLARATPAP